MTSLVKRPLPFVLALAVCAAVAGEASAACPNALSKTPTASQIAAISKVIAAGHAYQKHVVTEGQFKSTVTKATKGYALAELPIAATGTGAALPTAAQKLEAQKQSVTAFAGVIKSVMGGFELVCSSGRRVDANRRAFYDDTNNIIVIFNKLAADCGTSFRPDDAAQTYIESKGCGY